ncbi:MAG: NADH-quinone oxidoreductase subunit H [Candidatus Omnitrophica bacterium]|nr:NADH-quinone oxidoreductase subunit H [Candidatus Omnitrophota bacterium]MDD5654217.1 NADH-quinone oxidoreductase subunit H [Candidatus Omnitrophota bacterium]
MKILAGALQLALFIAISPFLSGLITVIKNNLRMRKGQSIIQPYYNLAKLFGKGEVVSETASWIFKAAPFVVFASSLAAAALVGGFMPPDRMNFMGDLLVLIFILALGRFFMALAALDTGSSFGGMGSSREMFISSLAEPAICLVIFAVSLQFGSSNAAYLSGTHGVPVSSIVASIAMFMVIIAETSRIPVDNQETHLELTMVHEAMVLEYSGKSLALIELASYIKQMAWFFLLSRVIFPGVAPLAGAIVIALIMAPVEVCVAKMRLFRVADFLGFAFVLALVAAVCAAIGV